MKRPIVTVTAILALSLGVTAQKQRSRLSLVAESCSNGTACKTFRQMVKAGDEDVLSARWACFYLGHNPAEKDDSPSSDEFFLLMDGKASITNGGKRPGIFVNRIKNGMPDGYVGFGPEHGGLEEHNAGKINPDGKEVIVSTYDDLGANIRWARFWFRSLPNDSQGVYRALGAYGETLMRKSTGRFTQKMISFNPLETTESAGRCFQLRGKNGK